MKKILIFLILVGSLLQTASADTRTIRSFIDNNTAVEIFRIDANTSPYITERPYDLNILNISVISNLYCSRHVYLIARENQTTVASDCKIDNLSINFLIPYPYYKIYQIPVDSNGWIEPEQEITGITADDKYFIVKVDTNSMGIFSYEEPKSVLDEIFANIAAFDFNSISFDSANAFISDSVDAVEGFISSSYNSLSSALSDALNQI